MTPDAVEFAKSVLWRLASIQADVYQNQLLLVEILARQSNQTASQVQSQWLAKTETLRQARYVESLDAAGIPHDEDSKEGDSPSRL